MAHAPKIDQRTPEGAAIVALFNGIKTDVEDSSGGWNGADIVDTLCRWFARLGIDTDSDPIPTTPPDQPATAYVVMHMSLPTDIAYDLAKAQDAAQRAETKYLTVGTAPEFRWAPDGADKWILSVFNPRTRRWNKCLRTVHAVPALSGPSAAPSTT